MQPPNLFFIFKQIIVVQQVIDRYFWIDIHYACFGIIATEDVVSEAPPIARWMVGKSLADIKSWLLNKKAKVLEIKWPG
jgi:hypothetical protein